MGEYSVRGGGRGGRAGGREVSVAAGKDEGGAARKVAVGIPAVDVVSSSSETEKKSSGP